MGADPTDPSDTALFTDAAAQAQADIQAKAAHKALVARQAALLLKSSAMAAFADGLFDLLNLAAQRQGFMVGDVALPSGLVQGSNVLRLAQTREMVDPLGSVPPRTDTPPSLQSTQRMLTVAIDVAYDREDGESLVFVYLLLSSDKRAALEADTFLDALASGNLACLLGTKTLADADVLTVFETRASKMLTALRLQFEHADDPEYSNYPELFDCLDKHQAEFARTLLRRIVHLPRALTRYLQP